MDRYAVLRTIAVVALVGAATTAARAGIFDTVDGVIDSPNGEYHDSFADSGDGGTVFANSAMDIDNVYYNVTEVEGVDMLYIGFTTKGDGFNTGSFTNWTNLGIALAPSSDGIPRYMANFIYAGSTSPWNYQWVQGTVVPGEPAQIMSGGLGSLYDVAVTTTDGNGATLNGFELGVRLDQLAALDLPAAESLEITVTLADFLATHVDQAHETATVPVPEPASLALSLAGLAMILRRRR